MERGRSGQRSARRGAREREESAEGKNAYLERHLRERRLPPPDRTARYIGAPCILLADVARLILAFFGLAQSLKDWRWADDFVDCVEEFELVSKSWIRQNLPAQTDKGRLRRAHREKRSRKPAESTACTKDIRTGVPVLREVVVNQPPQEETMELDVTEEIDSFLRSLDQPPKALPEKENVPVPVTPPPTLLGTKREHSLDEAKRKRKGAPLKCPFPECETKTKRMKIHVCDNHLPPFWSDLHPAAYTPTWIRKRMDAIIQLARWILGPTATLSQLVTYAQPYIDASYHSLPDDASEKFGAVCRELGYDVPNTFSLCPMNSPALLCFWRVIATILASCGQGIRASFRELVDSYEAPPAVTRRTIVNPSVSSRTQPSRQKTYAEAVNRPQPGPRERPHHGPPRRTREHCAEGKKATERPEGARISGSPRIPDGMDSHFHLDRIQRSLPVKLSQGQLLQDLCRNATGGTAHPVRVVGGIAVFCDPESYPLPGHSLPSGFGCAVGYHPTHSRNRHPISQQHLDTLSRLVRSPGVVALGEIGLDWHRNDADYVQQEEDLTRILAVAVQPQKPIVLHLRDKDRYGSGVSAVALNTLRDHCCRLQPIHVHCFTGTRLDVRRWTNTFPNVYFGFTMLADSFDSYQQEAVKEIPSSRLLLESDAPYFGGSRFPNKPAYIGEVAAVLARYRRTSTSEILKSTLANAKVLYGM